MPLIEKTPLKTLAFFHRHILMFDGLPLVPIFIVHRFNNQHLFNFATGRKTLATLE